MARERPTDGPYARVNIYIVKIKTDRHRERERAHSPPVPVLNIKKQNVNSLSEPIRQYRYILHKILALAMATFIGSMCLSMLMIPENDNRTFRIGEH